ncbi:ABC transporter permease [Arthrobacter sp. NPDC080073]|uniref:ABC transporter permease n=1 Tax=Arthrobacter sp. NPDC080073 TaxID=3155919 RepID=UPI0034470739
MRTVKSLGYFFGLPVLLVIIWWFATLGPSNFFVPKPGQLVETFIQTWIGPRFLTDVVPSILRLLAGLILAIVMGILGGMVIGSIRWLRQFLEPLLEFLRAIPPTILVPVLLLLIGINNEMKIAVIASGCVWPVLINTIEGVRAVDPVLSDTSRIYRISGFARIRHLVLRSASPQMMAGIRQSLSIGLILMVISEMFAASEGLGFAIVQFQRIYAIPEMWSGIALLGILGVALSFIFQQVQRRVLSWYNGQKEAQDAR